MACRVTRDGGEDVRAIADDAEFQLTSYGAVVSSAPSGAPSSVNCTPATPMSSDAAAATLTLPATVPAPGCVMATVGAAVSLVTVTLTVAVTI